MKVITPEREARSMRVQSLIKMTGMNRREFGRKIGISHSTLQHWESITQHGLPENSAKRFLKALTHCGIECTYEWLIQGTGPAPRRINRFEEKNVKKYELKVNENTQMAKIGEELTLFLKEHKEATEFLVPDDAMAPRFVEGEVVAGIRRYKQDIEKLIGIDCIVLIEGGDMYLRKLRKGNLPDSYHLTHTNLETNVLKPFFYDVKLVSAAPVIWARRKDP